MKKIVIVVVLLATLFACGVKTSETSSVTDSTLVDSAKVEVVDTALVK